MKCAGERPTGDVVLSVVAKRGVAVDDLCAGPAQA